MDIIRPALAKNRGPLRALLGHYVGGVYSCDNFAFAGLIWRGKEGFYPNQVQCKTSAIYEKSGSFKQTCTDNFTKKAMSPFEVDIKYLGDGKLIYDKNAFKFCKNGLK